LNDAGFGVDRSGDLADTADEGRHTEPGGKGVDISYAVQAPAGHRFRADGGGDVLAPPPASRLRRSAE
jgi:hypothetical protein